MIPSSSTMDKPVEKPTGVSRRTLVLLGLAVLGVGALLLALPTARRWSRADRAVDAARLRYGKVTRGDLVRDVSAQGQVVASLHPTLYSPAAGIVDLKVKAGATVKKGELLARVVSPELRSRLQQEKATQLSLDSSLSRQRITARQTTLKNAQNVDLLEVKLQAARRLLERAQRTFDEGLLNKTDFEKAKDDLQVATLELKNARETARLEDETAAFDLKDREISAQRQTSIVTELQRQVDELEIRSPFDGMVASVDVQDREAIAANRSVVTVVNLSAFEVEIRVAENEAAGLAPGTPAVVVYEGKELPAHVTALSPEVKDSQVKGTVAFDGEPPRGLRQSQRVTTRLVFESRPGVLKVPRGPFLEVGGGRQAYVVANGVATLRPIEVGAVSVSEVEVTKGLAEGEEIVLSDTTDFLGAKSVLLRK